jgi:hypothetical protein
METPEPDLRNTLNRMQTPKFKINPIAGYLNLFLADTPSFITEQLIMDFSD